LAPSSLERRRSAARPRRAGAARSERVGGAGAGVDRTPADERSAIDDDAGHDFAAISATKRMA
jgi:hypothetical protein